MLQPYQDAYYTDFSALNSMVDYHQWQAKGSRWERVPVNNLRVAPLDKSSSLYYDRSSIASGVSGDAIEDTAESLKLALKHDGQFYPLRDTAWKSLLDRAKIGGSALPKLEKEDLARILNSCLALHSAEALLLIRDEKVSATHSGDARDYSVLEIDQLLETVIQKLDERFPGNQFDGGYSDHSISSASWKLPNHQEELLGTYKQSLKGTASAGIATRLMPGIRFCTSDTGVASAKMSALLLGLQYPIHIGGMVSVDHRREAKIDNFAQSLDMLFAQYGDSIAKLERLTTITLGNPVNAMTAVCKKLAMPKKAALEAIKMFEGAYGDSSATAHDVFMGLQEIIFILKSEHMPEGKLLTIEENLARALTIKWPDYDYAKAVSY